MRKTIAGLLSEAPGHVHLAGICGVGMAGLALLLRRRGFRVTGCDLVAGDLRNWLERHEIEVADGHASAHVESGVDWLIRSRAVPDNCPDVVRALQLGLPASFRGEVLPALLDDFTAIAVSGTHGKTTTSSFIAQILRTTGYDPSWCIGGTVAALDGPAAVGDGDLLVVEADESDGTVARYHPSIAVVTNVEFDHMEHFEDVAAFESCFAALVDNTKQRVVYCGDDPRASSICARSATAIAYGLGMGADIKVENLTVDGDGQSFDLVLTGAVAGRWRLPVAGRHNVLNLLAAIAVCVELGLDVETIRKAAAVLQLPARRLEEISDAGAIRIISDYAHHPTEIAATIEAVSKPETRLMALFQPHRYTRTRALRADFPDAFSGLHQLVLVPVYAASEAPLEGGSTWDLYAEFRNRADGGAVPEVVLADSLEQAWQFLHGELCAHDTLLVIGAGDVERVTGWVRATGREQRSARLPQVDVAPLQGRLAKTELLLNEPMAKRTTLGVGGRADLAALVGSIDDLSAILEWRSECELPWRILGGGSNVLISDCGLRGVTILLKGGEFDIVRSENDTVTATAGVSLAHLTDRLTDEGRTGLEFLDGIPGTVGGALRMNAGAGGRAIAEQVSAVRGLRPDGALFEIAGSELGATYRSCGALQGLIVLEVVFALDRATPATVQERRSSAVARRCRWQGRSAGSVFRNPDGDHAGRLIEEAGLKGLRVGGAAVSGTHANVIVADSSASASDVKALMEIVRARVAARYGVCLENELVEL